MFYYKVLYENGDVMCLLTYDQEPNITDPLYVEITAEEHAAITAEFERKGALVEQLYRGEVTIDDVPEEWREEVQIHVDRIIEQNGEYVPAISESEATANEALAILHGEVAE